MPPDMIEDVIEQVERALSCGDLRNGYAKYQCFSCGETHVIAFTCKSRFCTSCGKTYIEGQKKE